MKPLNLLENIFSKSSLLSQSRGMNSIFMNNLFKPVGQIILLCSLTAVLSLPAVAASKLLAESAPIASLQKPQPPQTPRIIYKGRVKPEPPAPVAQRHVISESAGYHRYDTSRQNATLNLHSNQRPNISARLYYQAPSTTVINRHVEVIAPQNATSDVYFNQDTYYLYPSGAGPYHPARRYYQRVIPATNDPKDTESRAKQWTDRSGLD